MLHTHLLGVELSQPPPYSSKYILQKVSYQTMRSDADTYDQCT